MSTHVRSSIYYSQDFVYEVVLLTQNEGTVKKTKNLFQDQLPLNADQKYSAILSTFIKLPLNLSFVLSIFEWPFYTGFTVLQGNLLWWLLAVGAQEKQWYQGISFIQTLRSGASDAWGRKGRMYVEDGCGR